ncbi:hypothetical protein BP5796_05434 [Coleophoma crateriformis]|uniref:AMP-dependent synthetase/ligase domain-containing protein n=1 Tax=Coleophoma crateriformis TaxID=565419 RepID=A0A3D8S3A0_9HELO|nr:hypothetical protein BP5796_05434 [Coleophoma crateriformis]
MGSIDLPTIQNKWGQRLLPQILDHEATTDPDRPVAMMAKSEDISQGFDIVTTSQLAHAVNFLAAWIDARVEKSAESSSPVVIGYIGIPDFRYWTMFYASVKTGHPLLVPSTRNALPNTKALLDSTKCSHFFYTATMAPQAIALQEICPGLQIFQIPGFDEMLASPAKYYPYLQTWDEAKNDVFLIVHTSGSTGMPKALSFTHEWIGCIDSQIFAMPAEPGRELATQRQLKQGYLVYLGTPFFHLSGISFGFSTLFNRTTAVMAPSHTPPTAKIISDLLKAVSIDALILVPSLCDGVFGTYGEEIIEHCSKIKHIVWLGGPLSQSTGNFIVSNTQAHLWQIIGSTEIGPWPLYISPKKHWRHLEFNQTSDLVLEPVHTSTPNPAPSTSVEEEQLYEVVINRTFPDDPASFNQAAFVLFPELQQWRTRDLVRRVPGEGNERFYEFRGRIDDLLILSTGLKVNPLHVEMRVQNHPQFDGLVVFGTGYTRCGILIEPRKGEEKTGKEELLNAIWGDVEEANLLVPEHARVDRSLVVVATSLPRAGKGTVIRGAAYKQYAKEIKEVYEAAGIP